MDKLNFLSLSLSAAAASLADILDLKTHTSASGAPGMFPDLDGMSQKVDLESHQNTPAQKAGKDPGGPSMNKPDISCRMNTK